MNKSLRGENDNYTYRSADEMTLQEQIELVKNTLNVAMRLFQTNKSEYLEKKIIEIKQSLQRLEQMNAGNSGS